MKYVYYLYSEENIYRSLIDKYNFFLHNLLPNQVNIFPLLHIDDDIINYTKNNFYQMRYLIYPVYKYLWNKKNIFYDVNRKILICSKNNINLEYYNYKSNYELLRKIFVNNDIILERNNIIYIPYLNIRCTLEAYSYLYLNVFQIINKNNLNYLFILGILEASIELNICSLPFEQKNKINVNKNFTFSKITLKSLYVTNQIKIFKAWLNKSDVLLTGGTGIGKTSQIPKLFWWINYLYDGFDEYLNFNNFNFNLNDIINYKIKSRATILSLPRKILITENASNVANSLGFNEISNSPIDCIFKDAHKTVYHNKKINEFISPFLFTINKKTPINNINTLIFDEIHEHETFADIGITKARHYKKKNNINNIILITATISDDLENINKYFPNIERIHIKGETLFDITTIDKSKEYKNVKDLAKIINEYSTSIGKSTLIFLPSVSSINKIYLDLKDLLNLNLYEILILHRQILLTKNVLKDIVNYPKKHVIILSTPVAESSITISNANVVIDYGLFYCKQFFSGSILNITDSMMKQRKGRVGRVSYGTYIHLFSMNKINKNFKRIDYEFLLPYIINCYYYNIKFKDIFITPTDMNRFDKTIKYFKNKNLNLKYNINKVFDLYNKYYVNIPEYLIIYKNENDTIKELLNIFENSSFEERLFLIQKYKYEFMKIAKILNINFKIIKILDKESKNNKLQISVINYYENMPMIISYLIKMSTHPNNYYIIDENISINY